MKREELEGIVEAVMERAFGAIKSAYDFQKESSPAKSPHKTGTRIVFPKYGEHNKSGEVCRVSEQELRFVFVEQLNKYLDEKGLAGVYYSVETPTEGEYKFSGVNERSGNTDLTIHDGELKRICIIEFKALNPNKGYEKDIIKLNEEPCEIKYFIQIVKNADSGTINNLKEKTAGIKGSGIHYRCYCLEKGERLKEAELN